MSPSPVTTSGPMVGPTMPPTPLWTSRPMFRAVRRTVKEINDNRYYY